jgi:hypothetical protein
MLESAPQQRILDVYLTVVIFHPSIEAATDATSGGEDLRSGLVRARPFAIPIQAFCVGDAGGCFDVQAAQDLLYCTLNPGHN